MKHKSIPKKATGRKQSKTVKTNRSQDDKRNEKPCWRFSTVDRGGPFSWPKGQSEELKIVEKLHQFDSMMWSEILGSEHHYLSPSSLSKKAKERLEELKLDDEIENLVSFHLQGKPRIVCIRHNDLALLLWHDPQHQIAPSSLKHT